MVQENSIKPYNTIIIVGPTACGKTSLSIELAKRLNSEIVGADSLQIYKKLNIGTAKVTEEEKQGVIHHMIDIVEPNKDYSVSEYKKEATAIIKKIISSGRIPVVVGGTGFYIDALIGNNVYGECPANGKIRAKYDQILNKQGKEYIYSILQKIDPKTAQKLHCNDVKRVIRAIEIFETTGKTKSQIEDENKKLENNNLIKPLIIGLNLSDRQKLYDKIDKRVEIMFDEGLEKEVRELLISGLNRESQSLQAIGYKEFFDYLDNKIDINELKDLIKLNTRHYAKRQLTYFRRFDIKKWYNTDESDNIKITNDILMLLNNKKD